MAGWAAAGSIGGGVLGLIGQHSANKANIKLNRENRDWMERMSNTEYSRSIGDMLNAGLNPMLTALNGGNSTPSNTAPTVQNELEPISRGVNSAGSALMQRAAIEQIRANIDLTKANTYKATQEGNSAAFLANPEIQGSGWDKQQALIKAQTAAAVASGELSQAQANQVMQMLPHMKALTDAQTKAQNQQANSGRATMRLDELKVPESEAAARWFSSEMGQGGAGKAVEFIKQIMQILRGK